MMAMADLNILFHNNPEFSTRENHTFNFDCTRDMNNLGKNSENTSQFLECSFRVLWMSIEDNNTKDKNLILNGDNDDNDNNNINIKFDDPPFACTY